MTRFARRQSALAVALSSALAVDGCATPHTIIDDVGARSVPTNLAFVTLGPGAPGPLSIVETRYANATRQSIALVTHGQTQGENQMRADVFGLTNEGVAPGSTLADRPLNEVALFSEAEEALPNVPAHIPQLHAESLRAIRLCCRSNDAGRDLHLCLAASRHARSKRFARQFARHAIGSAQDSVTQGRAKPSWPRQ